MKDFTDDTNILETSFSNTAETQTIVKLTKELPFKLEDNLPTEQKVKETLPRIADLELEVKRLSEERELLIFNNQRLKGRVESLQTDRCAKVNLKEKFKYTWLSFSTYEPRR